MVLYYLRSREDGKTDVIEGDTEAAGRVVETLDTFEDAHRRIVELHQAVEQLAEGSEPVEVVEVLEAAEEVDMPWKLQKKGDKFCVVKKSDGSVEKCHDSQEEAAKHLKALYVNAADASIASIDELETTTVGDQTTEFFIPGQDGVVVPNETVTNLTAHIEPPAPPADFFSDPQLSSLQRYVTVTDNGRIMGHYAGPEDCHIGYLDACVPAPLTADSLTHWSVGTVKTADGVVVETGPLALRYGHADTVGGVSVRDAKAHYDDPDSGIADIVVGIDEHGGWFSGALRPGVSPEDVRKVLASGVSGDWRLIDGQLRLIGICSVNRPGFTKIQIAASADGQIEALVAAGGPPLPHPSLCDCDSRLDEVIDELDSMHRLLADAMIEDKVIDTLSSRIESDFQIEELMSRVS